MNTLRVLARPRVWGPVLGIVAVLTLLFYAYLGAVVSPEEKVAARITSSDSPAPDFVHWARLDDRDKPIRGLESGEYYAAIVIPKDYSQRLASLSYPAGASVLGYQLSLFRDLFARRERKVAEAAE